ncbi:MAG: sigma-70 family RNA polymerase sigma factor [Opitutaceae bacterium]
MRLHEVENEADCIRTAQQGDTAAFAVLYKRHYDRLYRTACGLVGNATDAQEITQQTWLKAWKKLDRYNFSSAFTTWLHRILVNTSLDHLRQRKRWSHRFKSMFTSAEGGELDQHDTVPAPNSDPADGLLEDERALSVRKAVWSLPEAQRVVIVLKEFEDYTYQEIADIVGCKIGTVMSRLHSARQKLQKLLAKEAL